MKRTRAKRLNPGRTPYFTCQNCGAGWLESQLDELEDVMQRVSPGERMPDGQCPDCGAVCHYDDMLNMNPAHWTDPDTLGASEYRTIHEFAQAVWDSNADEKEIGRHIQVRAGLEEMRKYLDVLLEAQLCR